MEKKRLFIKLIISLLLVALLLPGTFPVAYASNAETEIENIDVQRGIVTATGLNFRTEASTSSEIISTIPKGATVIILEESDEWLKVEYESQIGYLFKVYVEIVLSHGITTAASGLNVRSEPTTNSQVLDSLSKGTRVSILEEIKTDDEINPVWLKVSYLNGDTGYVSKQYVNILTNPDGTYRKTGVTTAKILDVRDNPNLSSKVITKLNKGSHVIILDNVTTDNYYKKWYQIDYGGEVGWIPSKYLEEQKWVFAAKSNTSSSASGQNRNYNMSLASNTLTGMIILPGETFSWLDTMECCSAKKGYLTAPVFVGGEISEGDGGGVCQVSTTFNIAIKELGISTIAFEHSREVGYADEEDEASVSYPNVDFSFTNTLDTPILVELVSNNGAVNCNIYTAKQQTVSHKKGSTIEPYIFIISLLKININNKKSISLSIAISIFCA